ncbi:MAG: GNAT family N-acetyltransferase [Aggregatilineales bacterium]
MIEIRSEEPEDSSAVRHIHEQAFPSPNEANLVDKLCKANKATVSLVAIENAQAVAHILFSPITIASDATVTSPISGLGLAPVAVLPELQKRGTGSALIRAGLEKCRELGVDIVVVLGNPRYYERFGFARADAYWLGNECGAAEDFMVIEFRKGILETVKGTVQYPSEFKEAGC